MKTMILALLMTTSLFAQANEENFKRPSMLKCGIGFKQVTVDLAPSHFSDTYNEAVDARIIYNYSNVRQMTCSGSSKHNEYDIDCVGFYFPKEITHLKIRTENEKVYALWMTSEGYGKESMKTECRFIYE